MGKEFPCIVMYLCSLSPPGRAVCPDTTAGFKAALNGGLAAKNGSVFFIFAHSPLDAN